MLDLIVWQRFCELAKPRIAYCPSIHVCLVWHLLLTGIRFSTLLWQRFCEQPTRPSMPMSIPSQIAVDCKSVHFSMQIGAISSEFVHFSFCKKVLTQSRLLHQFSTSNLVFITAIYVTYDLRGNVNSG